MLNKLRSAAQRVLDEPLVLWVVVGVLVVEGVLLALFVLGVL
jgi:hypothetical protein